ncbi:MAG: cation transporter [Candidatus Liptonbacteria bacterium]|nr:cation transporter [Candidatus Liptonbacteria bacterium]
MFIENGHLPWCPTLEEPCRCKPTGYAFAMVLALITAGIEFWGSGASHSLSLFGDAIHVSSDVLVYLVAIVAGIIAAKAGDKNRARTVKEKLAVVNANILIVVAFSTIGWAAWRISHPADVEAGTMLLISVIGLLLNGLMYVALKLFEIEDEHGGHDHLHRTTILHTLNDLGISFVVVATAGTMKLWPWIASYDIDSWVSIVICIWIMERANETKHKAEKAIAGEHHSHRH